MRFLMDLLTASASFNDSNLFKFAALVGKYKNDFSEISNRLYERLNPVDQQRFIAWFMKRWGKINTVDKAEWERYVAIVEQSHVVHGHESLGGVSYCLRRYESAGYNFSLLGYDWFSGVHDVIFDQYATEVFDVRPGDVIIDGGAFIGDTAVLFDAKTSGDCQIHAFELLDENITLMQRNLEMNGLSGKVAVNKIALGDESGIDISIAATRLQASTSLMFPGDIVVPMIKLDDYVKERHLSRVDFDGGCIWMRDAGLPVGKAVRIRILARDVSLATSEPTNTSIQNQLRGSIQSMTPEKHPSQVMVVLKCGAEEVLARVTKRAVNFAPKTVPGLKPPPATQRLKP